MDKHLQHPKRQRLGALALALAVSGCTTVGPDYQRPTVALPAQFPEAAPPASAAAVAPNWWMLYGEGELTRLVEQALAANADVAQAVARVEQAEGQLREAGGAPVPTVNAGANAGRYEVGASVPGNTAGRTVVRNDLK
ncbi:MAG: TolC family protein, partial [Rhodoferax sp.]|nr:TolC family protein [Rhodoferax sp.]